MQKQYRHLREDDRGVIYRMNKAGKSQQEIAQAIGFGQSTVSKELMRNCGLRGYRPVQAQQKAAKRKDEKRSRPSLIRGHLKEEIEKRLKLKHSPEQIDRYKRSVPNGTSLSEISITGFVSDLFKNVP